MARDAKRSSRESRRSLMARLRRQGLTFTEIGERLGVSRQYIAQTLHKANLVGPMPGIQCSECRAEICARRGPQLQNGPVLCLDCLAKHPETPFGKRLKSFRLAEGLTQKELADQIGSYPRVVAAYETGRLTPNWQNLEKLLRVFGARLVDLKNELGDEDGNTRGQSA